LDKFGCNFLSRLNTRIKTSSILQQSLGKILTLERAASFDPHGANREEIKNKK